MTLRIENIGDGNTLVDERMRIRIEKKHKIDACNRTESSHVDRSAPTNNVVGYVAGMPRTIGVGRGITRLFFLDFPPNLRRRVRYKDSCVANTTHCIGVTFIRH